MLCLVPSPTPGTLSNRGARKRRWILPEGVSSLFPEFPFLRSSKGSQMGRSLPVRRREPRISRRARVRPRTGASEASETSRLRRLLGSGRPGRTASPIPLESFLYLCPGTSLFHGYSHEEPTGPGLKVLSFPAEPPSSSRPKLESPQIE